MMNGVEKIQQENQIKLVISTENFNGLLLAGVYVGVDSLELILSHVKLEEILKLARVCRVWNNVTRKTSFWKLVYFQNAHQNEWHTIPQSVKQNEELSKYIFYAAIRHKIFSKNFVQNDSGQCKLAHWKHEKFDWLDNTTFIVESPPLGIKPLPPPSQFSETSSDTNSVFALFAERANLLQVIDLWKAGFTPEVIDSGFFFRFNCSVWIGPLQDEPVKYAMTATLLDSTQTFVVDRAEIVGILRAGEGWNLINFSTPGFASSNGLRYLALGIHGLRHFRGHGGWTGAKFSRICVKLECLSDQLMAPLPPQLKSYALVASQSCGEEKMVQKIRVIGSESAENVQKLKIHMELLRQGVRRLLYCDYNFYDNWNDDYHDHYSDYDSDEFFGSMDEPEDEAFIKNVMDLTKEGRKICTSRLCGRGSMRSDCLRHQVHRDRGQGVGHLKSMCSRKADIKWLRELEKNGDLSAENDDDDGGLKKRNNWDTTVDDVGMMENFLNCCKRHLQKEKAIKKRALGRSVSVRNKEKRDLKAFLKKEECDHCFG